MLRLVWKSAGRLAVTLHKKTDLFSRAFVRALIYSFAVHAFLLLVFHIRVPLLVSGDSDSTPLVFLEAEEPVIALSSDSKEDFRERLRRELFLVNSSFVDSSPLIKVFVSSVNIPKQADELVLDVSESSRDSTVERGSILQYESSFDRVNLSALASSKSQFSNLFGYNYSQSELIQSTSSFGKIPSLAWSLVDEHSPCRYMSRVYPLKIFLGSALRSSHLIEDGSTLFCPAAHETLLSTYAFAELIPKVEFKIDVDAASGKITHIVCIKELVDKRLQGFAEIFLKILRFAPFSTKKRMITGLISVQFAGSFDRIAPLVEWDELRRKSYD